MFDEKEISLKEFLERIEELCLNRNGEPELFTEAYNKCALDKDRIIYNANCTWVKKSQ